MIAGTGGSISSAADTARPVATGSCCVGVADSIVSLSPFSSPELLFSFVSFPLLSPVAVSAFSSSSPSLSLSLSPIVTDVAVWRLRLALGLSPPPTSSETKKKISHHYNYFTVKQSITIGSL